MNAHKRHIRPVERAAAVYEKEPCARSFKEDLEAHLLNGLVVSTPELFLMARPVCHAATREEIINPWFNSFRYFDCWHLYLYSGDMMSAFKQAGYKLPLVSFERRNGLRVYTWDAIYSACAKRSSPSYRTSLTS
jgi:hypothetical protein